MDHSTLTPGIYLNASKKRILMLDMLLLIRNSVIASRAYSFNKPVSSIEH